MKNDCTKCRVRLDGSLATYCYHTAWEASHPGDGRIIPAYPQTPKWCPGMVTKEEPSDDVDAATGCADDQTYQGMDAEDLRKAASSVCSEESKDG